MKPLLSGFAFVVLVAAVIGVLVGRETSPGAGLAAGLAAGFAAVATSNQLVDRRW